MVISILMADFTKINEGVYPIFKLVYFKQRLLCDTGINRVAKEKKTTFDISVALRGNIAQNKLSNVSLCSS